VLWGLTAFILIWLVKNLWSLNPQGWLFVVVMAVFDLILAFVSILGQSTLQALLPSILINALILIYCLLPGVKAAFTEPAPTAAPAAMPTAVRTMEAPPLATAAPAVRSAAVPLKEPVEEPAAEPPIVEIPAEEPVAPSPMEIVTEEPAAPPHFETRVEEVALPIVEESPAAAPAPQVAHRRHKVDIETIEGIGPAYAAKLKTIGVLTTADLLQTGASRKGREELVEKTGVSPKLILKWVNMADLMRISGVGEEYSELLEAAGVDTVKELKMRNPDNLHQAMLQANEQKKLVRRAPHLSEVRDWVEQAKQLEAIITY
jgi:predicted flap endonuclease-1-like 5' DNA nuclease